MQVKMSFAAVLESLRGSKSLFSVQDPLEFDGDRCFCFFRKRGWRSLLSLGSLALNRDVTIHSRRARMFTSTVRV